MVFSNQPCCSQLFEALRLNVAMGGTFGLCCDFGESSASVSSIGIAQYDGEGPRKQQS
jgi:hypothetical protein